MNIAFYGSSLLSSYWNGAATYYRGILRALAGHGYRITFYEPDAFDRQQHRDIDPPEYAKVVVYPATVDGLRGVLAQAGGADIVVKASGVGVFDAELIEGVLRHARPDALKLFWDVDAAATLDEMRGDPSHPVLRALPELDMVLTYGGGPPVVDAYTGFGAARCIPVYNALDPQTHHPAPVAPALPPPTCRCSPTGCPTGRPGSRSSSCALPPRCRTGAFCSAAMAGRTSRCRPISRRSAMSGTADHNAFNCSAQAVLNVARDSMAHIGFSPATRVFEAAGAAACLITDAWEGIELFLTPDTEVLVARDGQDVADHLAALTPARAQAIGKAALARVLAEHTYDRRGREVDALFRQHMARAAA